MWTTMACVAVLSLATGQAGELKLSNVRATYGVLGAARPDNKILPGDLYFIAYNIENLQADEEGKVLYSMGMELVNPKGESEYKRDPLEFPPQYYVLGGNRVPAFAHARTDIDTPPGEYTLKVTVIDRATKKSVTLAQKFQVLKKDFGLVELTASYDTMVQAPAPFSGVVGQSLILNFTAVAFERAKGQPNISFEMRLLDEAGKPTIAKPVVRVIDKGVDESFQRLPMNFTLHLSRPGKFTVKLKGSDLVSKKSHELTFPITVQEAK